MAKCILACVMIAAAIKQNEWNCIVHQCFYAFHLMQTGPKDGVHSTKARENGLCVSLLERIHAIYSNLDDSTCLKTEYMASLLTNYRCHEGTLYLCSTGNTRVRSGEGLYHCASCN